MLIALHFTRMAMIVLLLSALVTVPALTASSEVSAKVVQQGSTTRTLSGYILTQQNELLPNVNVNARSAIAEVRTVSDAKGEFRLAIPSGPITVRFEGKNVTPLEKNIGANEETENLQIKIMVVIAPIQASVVIQDTSLNPTIDQRNDTVYKNTLFERDDQLVETLNAGINAGQHEGGGKSLEIRRFGYNLDHGGVNGGPKVLVDDVQQNQGSQGHGQGYLGQLKSLSPELIDDVEILNGPFSAVYGDFSGLGVVQIRLKESFSDQLTLRLQGGNFNAKRIFVAYSPTIEKVDSFFAYEGAIQVMDVMEKRYIGAQWGMDLSRAMWKLASNVIRHYTEKDIEDVVKARKATPL